MEKQYTLEIYQPRSKMDVWEVFKSDYPFNYISRGDILNPNSWDHPLNPEIRLEVVGLEHLIWNSPNNNISKHKILVYTEKTDN